MVIIIIGFLLDNFSVFLGFMQVVLQVVVYVSVDIKNVLDFYKQWKEIG